MLSSSSSISSGRRALILTGLILVILVVSSTVVAVSNRNHGMISARYNAAGNNNNNNGMMLWGLNNHHQKKTSQLTVTSTIASLLSTRGGSSEMTQKEGEGEDDEDEDEDETDEDEDEDEEDEEETTSKSDITSKEPIKLLVRTSMNNKLLDQSVELNAVRTRSVGSLKKSLSRQLPGKPPQSMIRLMQHGQILDDEVIVDELMEDDDDEDDDDDEPAAGDDDDDDGDQSLTLVMDIVPPVDPRYSTQLEEVLPDMTTAELLEAYTLNEAAIWYNSQDMVKLLEEANEETEEEGAAADDATAEAPTSTPPVVVPSGPSTLITFQLKQYANALKSQLESNALTEKAATLLEDPIPPAKAELEKAKKPEVKGQRTRAATGVGAGPSSNVVGLKQTAQHYLNINWGDTIRNFCLFLFFGWFGGRTITSRAILLLGAPLCFIVQARPMKLLGKELFYLFLKDPPGIILSLMPAPQQALLALSDEDAMKLIYGDDAPSSSEEAEEVEDDEEEEDDEEDESESEEEEDEDEESDEDEDDSEEDDSDDE